MSCGEDAAFTKRLEANDKRIEVIGGSDKYMAVCRNCWHSNKEKGNFCSWPSSKKKSGIRDFFRNFLSKFYGQDLTTSFSTLKRLKSLAISDNITVIYRNQHLVALL